MAGIKKLYEFMKININEFLAKSENKEETLQQLIIDMQNQADRLEYVLSQDKEGQKSAYNLLEKARIESKILEEKARLALHLNNQKLAKQALEQKYLEDINLKEKEIIYNTLNAQASQLGEQLETLKCKLEEAKEKQKMFITCTTMHNIIDNDENKELYILNNNYLNESENQATFADSNCFECSKSKEIIEAELERLMDDIRANHNII